MNKKESTIPLVYVGMAADFIHAGHIHLLKEASKYGNVIVGLLTDKAISSYKRIPMTTWEQRKEVIENIKFVSKVIPQETLDYTDNILKYKPHYIIHGDDWKEGIQKATRDKAIKAARTYGGLVIDINRINVPSSTDLVEYETKTITPEYRKRKLRKLLELKSLVRVLEAHSGLSGLIVENAKIDDKEFDAIWISSLTDSIHKGKPDIEIVDFTSRCNTINEILEITKKPLIVDGDTGGTKEHFQFMIRTLERLGVSAIIIEDKKFPKINSLMDNAFHIQEDKNIFADKIKAGIQARISEDFMIIARIESLIIKSVNELPIDDAIDRAKTYIDAGADAIMIHSKMEHGLDILLFCDEYSKLENKVPLVMVPTTYNTFKETDLESMGANIIIYANHLLRSSHKAMKEVARNILKYERSLEVDDKCTSVEEILGLI